ncbi:hypothetical protein KP004_14815 [Geomonas oryzisoli]|uniref:Collagen-like protein n=1 Tax=Geomonas oryzisoli TaxID=2847992 RepID=A0ABX8J2J2_9BACT|nr:hypothetical protein [Geomonas oryzisoli]QWV92465.1 hypothetical protein KP004_14815 [Geomonas oryzisoli]
MNSRKMIIAALCAVPLSVLPVVAGAVETDRITVEDPSTGTVKFKVTSEGNVTAGQYTGDGALLQNVAHFKGAWSSATVYAKDDVVTYGGGSYIALAASTNAQPDLVPASWTVMAQKGATGADGAAGATGPQGPTGATGPQGPTGASPFALSGNNAYYSAGSVGIGTSTPAYTLDVAGQIRIAQAGVAGFTIKNTAASFSNAMTVGGVGNPLYLANWSLTGVQDDVTKPSWGIGLQINNDQLVFQRAPAGSNTLATQMVIKNTGNVGFGTTTPTQRVEVNGGLRLNTVTAKPTCDTNARGTFWLTRNGTGVMDTLEVCIKDATEAYVWKPVW